LPVTEEVAACWGRFAAVPPAHLMDSLIAATAIVHGLQVATRNTRDFELLSVKVLDPFAAGPARRD
jgi:predicted nucleic acid-binding protein